METATDRYIEELEERVQHLEARLRELLEERTTKRALRNMRDKEFIAMKLQEDSDPKTWSVPATDHMWTRAQFKFLVGAATVLLLIALGHFTGSI